MQYAWTTSPAQPAPADRAGDPGGDAEPLQTIVEEVRALYLTVGEMAYAIIRQAILNGVLEPGEHLRQDALARAIGVSRLPVRSALLQLESEGLVVLQPHRGFTVRELDPEQVREIYEIRSLLETHALRKAISSMTIERIERLERLADQLDQAEDGDFAELSFAFYRELYGAEEHPLLVSLIERLHGDVGRYWVSRRLLDRQHAAHAKLLEHARSGDTAAATAWLEQHLSDVAEQLISLLSAPQG